MIKLSLPLPLHVNRLHRTVTLWILTRRIVVNSSLIQLTKEGSCNWRSGVRVINCQYCYFTFYFPTSFSCICFQERRRVKHLKRVMYLRTLWPDWWSVWWRPYCFRALPPPPPSSSAWSEGDNVSSKAYQIMYVCLYVCNGPWNLVISPIQQSHHSKTLYIQKLIKSCSY